MKRDLEFSPMIIIKEKDGSINTAVVVDNGPKLMKVNNGDVKAYTEVFNDLIECFPTILTATFYGRCYTSYRIKVEGEDVKSIIGIKKYIEDYMEED